MGLGVSMALTGANAYKPNVKLNKCLPRSVHAPEKGFGAVVWCAMLCYAMLCDAMLVQLGRGVGLMWQASASTTGSPSKKIFV